MQEPIKEHLDRLIYFAAHAPVEIPKWFEIDATKLAELEEKNKQEEKEFIEISDKKRAELTESLNEEINYLKLMYPGVTTGWRFPDSAMDSVNRAKAELIKFNEEITENLAQMGARWIAERSKVRYFAWRWYYAEQICSELVTTVC